MTEMTQPTNLIELIAKAHTDGYKHGLGAFFNEITNCKDLIGINNVEYLSMIYEALRERNNAK